MKQQYEAIHINDLCRRCGYFEPNTLVNSGYGCNHPDQQEIENSDRSNFKDQGKCYAHSCPLGDRMDAQDWKERGEDPESYDDEWILLHELEKQ